MHNTFQSPAKLGRKPKMLHALAMQKAIAEFRAGASVLQIAHRCGVSFYILRKALVESGLSMRGRGGRGIRRGYYASHSLRRIPVGDLPKMFAEIRAGVLSYTQIAKHHGLSRQRVSQLAIGAGIKRQDAKTPRKQTA